MLDLAIIILSCGLLTAAVLFGWLTWQRLRHVELLCLRNSEDVACFADSTLSIGRAVQSLADVPDGNRDEAGRWSVSRRLLIEQARRRLQAGDTLAEVAVRYQLSGDEQVLMGIGQRFTQAHPATP